MGRVARAERETGGVMPMKPTVRAHQLRKTMTPQEARLWLELRALRLQGFHFRRQAPVKGFFLDFVCFQARLAVEVDGGQHGDDLQADHDAMRTAILARAGFRVLRVWNNEVNTNLDGVMYTILHALGAIEDHPTRPALTRGPPSPSRGGRRTTAICG